MNVKAIIMDITKIGKTDDAIVNAANESLLGGGGVDGTGKTTLIHEYIKNNLDNKILCLTTTNTAKNNLKTTMEQMSLI